MYQLIGKAILAIAFFSSVTPILAQNDLGVGLVSVNFNVETILHFYERPGAANTARTVRFFNDESISSLSIRDLESVQKWLKPESLWLDYYSFVFRCRSKRAGWFEVIVNNDSGQTYWVRESKFLEFQTWNQFLKGMFSIARSSSYPQKILRRPESRSLEIKYRGRDCFDVKSMRGDWVEIRAAAQCDDAEGAGPLFRSGWIRWKRGNRLLVDYFITS